MKLVFLGTSAVFPTKDRNHSSIALDIGPEIILFDCGEGTQRQIRIAKLSPMKISTILITHWHGDHVLGLAGLLESFYMAGRTKPLEIYGPRGTKEHFAHMVKAFGIKAGYKISINEVLANKPKKVKETVDYEIWAARVKHTVPCLAWSWVQKPKIKINKEYIQRFGLKAHPILKKLQQGEDIVWKGKTIKAKDATFIKEGVKITYIVDTLPVENAELLAKDSDFLICEATFTQEFKDVAAERGHMTAKQTAKLAKKAKVKQLIITHFSQRFKTAKPLLDEAIKQFKNTIAAKDFLEIKIDKIKK